MSRLRVAILAEYPDQIEPWAERLLLHLSEIKNIETVGFIQSPKGHSRPKGHFLLRLITAFEKRLFVRPGHNADLKLDKETRPSTLLSTETDKIKALDIDVILDLDCAGRGPDLSSMTRFGTWFIDIFDMQETNIGFWAAAGRDAVSKMHLQRYVAQSTNPQPLAVYALNSKFIAARNANFMKEKAPELIIRELARLSQTGALSEIKNVPSDQHISPNTLDIIKYIYRVIMECFHRLLAEIAVRFGRRPDMFFFKVGSGTALSFDPTSARDIIPTGNNYWADPFLWKKDGDTYCFFENYDYKTNTGHICAGRFDGNSFTVLGDALKLDYHLSFPFLFEHDTELYMLPETHEAQRIEVWRCAEFPLKWEPHATALEGKDAADTVLLKKDNAWWIFTNIASGGFSDHCSELHIFQVDGPDMNTITPHALNPVVLDTRTARNGGRIHEIDGRLYRISQDNAHGQYGYGLNVMEIKSLSLTEYSEKTVRRIEPDFEGGLTGCHHFDALGDQFIMDVQKRRGRRG